MEEGQIQNKIRQQDTVKLQWSITVLYQCLLVIDNECVEKKRVELKYNLQNVHKQQIRR